MTVVQIVITGMFAIWTTVMAMSQAMRAVKATDSTLLRVATADMYADLGRYGIKTSYLSLKIP